MAWICPPPGRIPAARTASCGCCSWAERRNARDFPCCCAPSRRCAARAWTLASRSPAPPRRRSSHCCSSPTVWTWPGGWTTRRSGACWARPTCSVPRPWVARASAWCSRRRSPPAPRWWPPTSPAIATWSTTTRTASWCRWVTRWSSARPCVRWLSIPPGAPEWPRPRASAPSALPGRGSRVRSQRSTRGRSRSRSPRAGVPAWPSEWASCPPSRARGCRLSACPRSSRRSPPPAGAAQRAPRAASSSAPAPWPASVSPRWPCSGSASSRSAARCWPPRRSGCWWASP